IAAKEPPRTRAPHAGWMTVQAGLLTCGSMLRFRLPEPLRPSGTMEGSSPPTVAGAVADLALSMIRKDHAQTTILAAPHSHLAGLSTSQPEHGHVQNDSKTVNATNAHALRMARSMMRDRSTGRGLQPAGVRPARRFPAFPRPMAVACCRQQ